QRSHNGFRPCASISSANGCFGTAPPQSTPVPGGIGAERNSLVLGIEVPSDGQKVHTDRDFLIVGYSLDTSAKPNQGVQGSGIERVEVWMDIPPEHATQMGDAELGFS